MERLALSGNGDVHAERSVASISVGVGETERNLPVRGVGDRVGTALKHNLGHCNHTARQNTH